MNTEVFITCAVTGVGATTDRSELVPVTPAQIADAALEAARAGAAIAHIHVRNPETGGPSRDPALYREVVERTRSFLNELLPELDGARVLLIGHSANRWSLEHLLLGTPLEELVAAPFDWQEGWLYRLDGERLAQG